MVPQLETKNVDITVVLSNTRMGRLQQVPTLVSMYRQFLFTKHVLCAGIVVKVDFLLREAYVFGKYLDLDMGFFGPFRGFRGKPTDPCVFRRESKDVLNIPQHGNYNISTSVRQARCVPRIPHLVILGVLSARDTYSLRYIHTLTMLRLACPPHIMKCHIL